MRKRRMITMSALSAAVAGSAAYFLKEEGNRTKLKQYISNQKHKYFSGNDNNSEDLPVEKAGHPDPENVPDNKMVSEGAQFGVQYYEKNKMNQ